LESLFFLLKIEVFKDFYTYLNGNIATFHRLIDALLLPSMSIFTITI
jgi:hypothetical protein